MADCAEKAQHLRRCSPQTMHNPRVACTTVWQPWAIKRTTLTALRSCDIRNGGYIHLDIGITPMALRDERIHHGRCIQ